MQREQGVADRDAADRGEVVGAGEGEQGAQLGGRGGEAVPQAEVDDVAGGIDDDPTGLLGEAEHEAVAAGGLVAGLAADVEERGDGGG